MDFAHSSSEDDCGVHSLLLDSSMLVGLSSLGLNNNSLLFLNLVESDILYRHSLVDLSLLSLILSSNSGNLLIGDLLELLGTIANHSHLSLMSMLHGSSLHDLSLEIGSSLNKSLLHLGNGLLLDDLGLDLLLDKLLLLLNSGALDLSLPLLDDDLLLPLLLNNDLLLASSLSLDQLDSSNLLLSPDLLLSHDSFSLYLSNSLESVRFSLHSSGFLLHHCLLPSVLCLFSSGSEGFSFSFPPDRLLSFPLGLLFFDGFLLFSLDSFLLELLLLLSFLLFDFLHFASSASTFFFRLFSLDFGSFPGSSGSLNDRDLGFSFLLNLCSSF